MSRIACCLALAGLHASQAAQSDIESFKQAISSPPGIEAFEADMRTLRETLPPGFLPKTLKDITPAVQFYSGAIAGTNFYLEYKSLPTMLIAGRSPSGAYNVVSNAVYFGTEGFDAKDPTASDRINQACDSAFQMVCQFLRMGLADVDPHSVTWSGEEFAGRNLRGASIFGRLEVSNDLPCRLTLTWQKGGAPFKRILYTYRSDASFSGPRGFPAVMTIETLSRGELLPFLRLELLDVRLARYSLPDSFFDAGRFIGKDAVVTNVFSHDKLVSISPRGSNTVSLESIVGNRRLTLGRLAIYACLAILALLPFAFLRSARASSSEQRNHKPK